MNKLLDPKLAFMAGWLAGRQNRRRAGVGCLLIGLGLFFGCSGVMLLISAPLSWLRARDSAALPQPAPAALATLPVGTRALIVAQLPPDLPSDASGLAVFYVERLAADTSTFEQQPSTTQVVNWQIITPPPPRIGMALADREPLLVQITSSTHFLNAHQVALDGQDLANSQRRAVGYQPGQVLTLQGTWEGNGLFTATELYAGTPADYLASLRQMSGLGLVMGFACGGVGFFLLVLGVLLRFVGR